MTEEQFATAIVDEALKHGWLSLHDGEEWVIKHSRDRGAILRHMFDTEEAFLTVRTDENVNAQFWFIWGGNWNLTAEEALTDYTDNALSARILSNVRAAMGRHQ